MADQFAQDRNMVPDSRAEFEAWISESGKWPQAIERSGDGYQYSVAQSAWTTWQAATQRQQERIAELDAQVQALSLDAGRWRYSVAIGENQVMNWLDVWDDWDGDGDFTTAIDAATAAGKGT